jgi:hypothetical protein
MPHDKNGSDGTQTTDNQQTQLPEWADPTKPDMLEPEAAAGHWKKRFSDSQAYIEELKKNQPDPKKYAQLEELQSFVSQDPEIADFIYKKLHGQSQQQPAQQGVSAQPQQSELKPPEDFDPYQIHNPNTSSGQWFQQVQQSQLNNLSTGILQQVNQQIQAGMNSINQTLQTQKQQQEFEKFTSASGLSTQEQAEFETFLKNGLNRPIGMNERFKVFQALTGKTPTPNVSSAPSLPNQKDFGSGDFGKGLKKAANQRTFKVGD